MKSFIIAQVRAESTEVGRLGQLREWIQSVVLHSLYARTEGGCGLSFVGGTALRFLHQSQRYSEDLDFALEKPELLSRLDDWARHGEQQLRRMGLDSRFDWKERDNAVRMGWVRVEGDLMAKCGFSSTTLRVKVEIDTNPPGGAKRSSSFVTTKIGDCVFRHDDLPSLFAGKIHALLFRRYTKGRDWYDLQWYLARKVIPNEQLLVNAVNQTGGVIEPDGWRQMILRKLDKVDWDLIRADLRKFMDDVSIVNADLLRPMLESDQKRQGRSRFKL
ncbi:MAG TPA: nucleotidyl transferase AbiEii/AbiGii toxin family protein [Opitutales bacterium]|nr:nucleotidyl transferase AbiEii/AbiGii toxin family protein [Opitutales bacterium]